MQREKESEGEREGERVDQLRLPFCLLLIFVSSRSRFVFLCFLTVCHFFDVSFVRFFTSRRDTFSLLFRCWSPDRRLCLFIVDFNSKSCKLKLVKWGFVASLMWPIKRSTGNCFETVSIAEVISSTERENENERMSDKGKRLKAKCF